MEASFSARDAHTGARGSPIHRWCAFGLTRPSHQPALLKRCDLRSMELAVQGSGEGSLGELEPCG